MLFLHLNHKITTYPKCRRTAYFLGTNFKVSISRVGVEHTVRNAPTGTRKNKTGPVF